MTEGHEHGDVALLWDIHLVGALMAAGQEVAGVSWHPPNRAYFRLPRSPQLDRLLLDYAAGRLRVDARAMADATRALKSLLAAARPPASAGRAG